MVSINTFSGVAISLVVLVFIVGMGAQILGELQDQQTADSYEYNTTQAGLEAMDLFGDWFSIKSY